MPRIPDDEINRLRREASIVAWLEARDCQFRRHGAHNLVCRCPFPDHTDETPSFMVEPEKNVWHCAGCGRGGSNFDLVMELDGVEFRDAAEILSPLALLARHEPAPAGPATVAVPVADLPPPEACPLPAGADDATLLGAVADFYHCRLLATPAARDYLTGCGVGTDEAMAAHRLGFVDRRLGLALPSDQGRPGDPGAVATPGHPERLRS